VCSESITIFVIIIEKKLEEGEDEAIRDNTPRKTAGRGAVQSRGYTGYDRKIHDLDKRASATESHQSGDESERSNR
jgi:hypothetical protein